jgi:tellurite resistance protein
MIFSENRLALFRIMPFLMEHDLFGKPVATFPDHAQSASNVRRTEQRAMLARLWAPGSMRVADEERAATDRVGVVVRVPTFAVERSM